MGTSVRDIVASLQRTAPLDKAAGWDPVGLQLGDPDRPVRSVAVVHEVTTAVADRLQRDPVDLLVAYHPLLFRPVTRLVPDTSPTGRAFRLIAAGVALAVVHTAWDVAPGGAADALADELGLTAVTPFGPSWTAGTVKVATFVPPGTADEVVDAMAGAGAGTIGNYSACSFRTEGAGTFHAGEGAAPTAGEAGRANTEPETRIEMVAPSGSTERVVAALVAAHPYEEPAYDVHEVRSNAGFVGRAGALPDPVALGDLALRVESSLGGALRVAGDPGDPVARVAVIPGSGGSFLDQVTGVDVVVTGDVGHHQARRALDRGLAVIDPGHVPSERPGVARLYAAVSQIVDGAVDMSRDADPWELAWKS